MIIAFTLFALFVQNEVLSLLVVLAWTVKGAIWLFKKMKEGGIV